VVGNEVCGTVAAVGDDVTQPKLGSRVVTERARGAYAEYCVAPADFVAAVAGERCPHRIFRYVRYCQP
jgi:NADPH2:quinone reductase